MKVKDVFHKKTDSKESNTAKGVNIAIEFNEFKDVLLNKKIIRHKMKRIPWFSGYNYCITSFN